MALDMSPSTFSLPCMKAVIPSSLPSLIACQSSQLTLIVVSAWPSSSVTWLAGAVEHHHAFGAEVELHPLAGEPGALLVEGRGHFALGHDLPPAGFRPSLLYVNVRSRGGNWAATSRHPGEGRDLGETRRETSRPEVPASAGMTAGLDRAMINIHKSVNYSEGGRAMENSEIIPKGNDGYYHPEQ